MEYFLFSEAHLLFTQFDLLDSTAVIHWKHFQMFIGLSVSEVGRVHGIKSDIRIKTSGKESIAAITTLLHRAPCTGHKDIKHHQSSFGWMVTFNLLLRRSSTSLSVLAQSRHVRSLCLRSKLQSSVRYKEPARPIRFSSRRPLHQCVTRSMPALSFLSLVGLFFFPPLTSALTFGDFSQLFLSPFFFLFSFFLFSIYFFFSFFFFPCPPSSVIIMPIPCFVLLFLFGDFYGDSALPRNNESLGGLRSANSHDFFINRQETEEH